MSNSQENSSKSAAAGDLQPCRSPYCECDPGKCKDPERYDARGEAMPSEVRRRSDDPAQIADDLRAACEKLRRTSMPLADMIPLMQRAADALNKSASPLKPGGS